MLEYGLDIAWLNYYELKTRMLDFENLVAAARRTHYRLEEEEETEERDGGRKEGSMTRLSFLSILKEGGRRTYGERASERARAPDCTISRGSQVY